MELLLREVAEMEKQAQAKLEHQTREVEEVEVDM
jgi:hypothetical protein